MAIVVNTYTSSITGITYELKAFSPQLLYSPQEKRNIKQGNDAFYSAKQQDKLALQRKEAEAKRPRQMTEQEAYELAVERDNAKKAEQAAYEAQELAKVKAHEEFLNSNPPMVQVVSTNFYVWTQEMHHWQSKGYTIIVDTLEAMVPSLFSCQLTAPAPSKKK